jgi:hypothetical protein
MVLNSWFCVPVNAFTGGRVIKTEALVILAKYGNGCNRPVLIAYQLKVTSIKFMDLSKIL